MTELEVNELRRQFVAELHRSAMAIFEQETIVLQGVDEVNEQKEALEKKKVALLTSTDSPINGKNSEIRSAQLTQHTDTERKAIDIAEDILRHKTAKLQYLKNRRADLHKLLDLMDYYLDC